MHVRFEGFAREGIRYVGGTLFLFLTVWIFLYSVFALFSAGLSASVLAFLCSFAFTVISVFLLRARIAQSYLFGFYLLQVPLYWLSSWLPVQRGLWVFGSRQGTAFCENPKYLYLHVVEHRPDIKAVWVSKSRKVMKELQVRGLPCVYAFSPRGYYLSARSECVFFSHTKKMVTDFNDYVTTRKTFRIQLWHGTPIKKIGVERPSHQSEKCNRWVGKAFRVIFPFLENRFGFHKFLAPSRESVAAFKDAFMLKDNNFLLCGYPKNDPWLRRSAKRCDLQEIVTKKVIYMPTWRSSNWEDDFKLVSDYKFSLERLQLFCEKNDLEFYFRFHPYAMVKMRRFESEIRRYSRLHLENAEDIYEDMHQFDILISDYSSVMFDFLLSDRPVIYAWFDLDQYYEKEGFFYEPKEILAGPVVNDWLELERQIELTIDGMNSFVTQADAIRQRFNEYQHEDNASQLCRLVDGILAEESPFYCFSTH